MNNKKHIILASGSPRRRELLEQIGLPFEVRVSDADERITAGNPQETVCRLSLIKAQAVWDTLSAKEKKSSLVIGADTVVFDRTKILGKPKTQEEAFVMLKGLSGNSHSVFTGVSFLAAEETLSFCEETVVSVYEMSDAQIRRYIATKEPMDKAGAYGIQGAFAAFVKGIQGDYNNVVGLPVARVYQELRKGGYLDDSIDCQ